MLFNIYSKRIVQYCIKKVVFLLLLVMALSIVAFFIIYYDKETRTELLQQAAVIRALPFSLDSVTKDNDSGAITVDSTRSSEQAKAHCQTVIELTQSEDWLKLQKWNHSWGAPTFYAYGKDRIVQTPSPYLQVHEETLLSLSSYVPEAAYALGMNMIWSALAEVEVSPMLTEYPDTTHIRWRKTVNDERLAKGRQLLYQAAVNGHLYSLIELSFSYAYQINNIESSKELSKETIHELKLNAIKYGELVESLIEGMDDSFFQSRYQKELTFEEVTHLVRIEKEKFLTLRLQQGLGDLKVVVPREHFTIPVPCKAYV